MTGGGGSSGGGMMMQPAYQPPPAPPPAPGSLTQTIIGGNPNITSLVGGTTYNASGPVGVGPVNANASTPWERAGITYEEWIRMQQQTGTIVGAQSGSGGADAGGDGSGSASGGAGQGADAGTAGGGTGAGASP